MQNGFVVGALRSRSGTALAEMAIVAPLMVFLLVGLMELGRYAQFSVVVANAARAGVQYGAQNLATAADVSGMQTAVQNDAQHLSAVTATATQYCTCADGTSSTCAPTDCSGSHRQVFVKVDASGTFPSLLHFPGIPSSQTVTSEALMRVAE